MITRAAAELDRMLPGVRVAAFSRMYHTAPIGPPDQPWYANAVAALVCQPQVSPGSFFAALARTERALGRNRIFERRWGARTIDLDLLLFGGVSLNTPWLTLPHPMLARRAFVLLPLAEIAPGLALPGGRSIGAALAELSFANHGNIIVQTDL